MRTDIDNPRESEMTAKANGLHDASKRRTLGRLAAWGFLALTGHTVLEGCGRSAGRRLADGAGTETKPASLVICVLDAARADHLGCYGYPRGTTPNIDRLAAESTVFLRHFCQAPFTHASTTSLFTSQYPDTHLVYGSRPTREDAFTLAGALGEAGFQTALFSSIPWASPAVGVGTNFADSFGHDELAAAAQDGETRRSPKPLVRLFEEWLEQHKDDGFLAYLHFCPPHWPYEQPEEHTAVFAGKTPPRYSAEHYHPNRYGFEITGGRSNMPPLPEWINLYDANLRYGDWAIGEVERILRDAGVLDKTLLIITADHGEAFGEHGYVFHKSCPYEEALHIPLVMHFPRGSEVRSISALTQTIDIMPTILDLLAIPRPESQMQGRSLIPLMRGESKVVNDYVFSRAGRDPHCEMDGVKYTIRDEEHALILYSNGRWRALYDMRADPGQRRNIIDQQPEAAEELLQAFASFAETQVRDIRNFYDPTKKMGPVPEGTPERTRELQEKLTQLDAELRALGYLR